MNKQTMIVTEYEKDIRNYFAAKCTELPSEKIMEISAYIGNRTSILLADIIIARDAEWNEHFRTCRSK